MTNDQAVELLRWAYTLQHSKPADGLYPSDWLINAVRMAAAGASVAVEGGIALQLQLVPVGQKLPDADTDVLIFDASHEQGRLGAYVGNAADKVLWVSEHGDSAYGVTHWAELPCLPRAKP